MLRNRDNRRMQAAFVALFLIGVLMLVPTAVRAQDRELDFDGRHRINAHGTEFNGLAMSADRERLFVATEKGHTIVWNIAAGRVEQRLDQSQPVHLIAALAGAQEFVAAGSNHFEPRNAVIRRWDAKTGVHADLDGVDKSSFPLALATEPNTGLIALTTIEGAIHVWEAASNRKIATWELKEIPFNAALVGRDLYVLTVDRRAFDEQEEPTEIAIVKFNVDDPKAGPLDYLRLPERKWQSLEVTPDRRALLVTYESQNNDGERLKTVLIDPVSKNEIARLPGSNIAWIDSTKLVEFDWRHPKQLVEIQPGGNVVTRGLGFMPADDPVNALGISGQVASADGSKAWATYSRVGGLLEFDLATKKMKSLIYERPGAYTISVESVDGEAGQLLTGGSDGYVRLWKLSDISLIREYPLLGPAYFVRDAILLAGGDRAIVSVVRIQKDREAMEQEPLHVLLLDLKTSQHRKIAEVQLWRHRLAVVDNQIPLPRIDRIQFLSVETGQVLREVRLSSPPLASAVSANKRWLAIVDNARRITVFDLTTLKNKSIASKSQDAGPLAITDDGRYVYRVVYGGELLKWDMKTATFTKSVLQRIRDVHSSVDFMMLANDDKWIVVAGNHGDVGIFDRVTSRLVSYTSVSAAAFWVERVWIRGDRMIFTTDTGALFDGRLK